MDKLGTYALLFFIAGIFIFALIRRVPVFDTLLNGAKSGIETAVRLLPALTALLFSVGLLTASGLPDALAKLLSPLLQKIGFPPEVLPLCLLSPFSGSGSLSAFQSILETYGPDSAIGRTASIIAGSTETTFYAITVYYGAVGIKKTRHTLAAAMCADFTSFLLAGVLVRLFFN